MDNYQYLYKGADGWEDWSTTFERNASVRRSVVVKEGADGGWDIDGQVHVHVGAYRMINTTKV